MDFEWGDVILKVSELFSRALALLNEDESRAKSFKKNVLPLVNQILAQTLSAENAIRDAAGEMRLDEAQKVSGFDEDICYNKNFAAECFPYALAALLCADDDKPMSNAMGDEFERLKKKYSVANFEDINNCYA